MQLETPQKLTPKQQKFVEHYVQSGNATQAVERAGYSTKKNANRIASQNLSRPWIKAAIKKRARSSLARMNKNTDAVLQRLMALVFADITDFCEFNGEGIVFKSDQEIDPAWLGAIQSVKSVAHHDSNTGQMVRVEREFKLRDNIKPLEMLMKYLGLLDKNAGNEHNSVNINQLVQVLVQHGRGPTNSLIQLPEPEPAPGEEDNHG